MKNIRWGMSACVAVLTLALGSGVASAQQKAPDAPAAADVKKAAPKAAAPAKKAEPAKKVASACAGVEPETTCLGNTECMWVKELTTKAGVKRKAHCQKKPPPPVKKAAAPVTAPATAPAAKAAAPAAPKAVAPAAPAAPATKN